MKNWRREAALKTMPLIAENRVRTPWREFWRRSEGSRWRCWPGCLCWY